MSWPTYSAQTPLHRPIPIRPSPLGTSVTYARHMQATTEGSRSVEEEGVESDVGGDARCYSYSDCRQPRQESGPEDGASFNKTYDYEYPQETGDVLIWSVAQGLPPHVWSHTQELRQARHSPRLESDVCFETIRGTESAISSLIFPSDGDHILGSRREVVREAPDYISQHLVPSRQVTTHPVFHPRPDMLYGYSEEYVQNGGFTEEQLVCEYNLDDANVSFTRATESGLRFPFLAVVFANEGSVWDAMNHGVVTAAAGLYAMGRLNDRLREYGRPERVDDTAYSLAVDECHATLLACWKVEDGGRAMIKVAGEFDLRRPSEVAALRDLVRNIIEWAREERLARIKMALSGIVEEMRRRASAAANAPT